MAKSRKELEQRQRRKYILECAERLFAEKGFAGVTVADIAKATEFSVGSLYLFFDSKEALIKELLFERMKQIHEIISAQATAKIPAREKLGNSVDKLVDMFVEHIDFFKLYIMEVKGTELCPPPKEFGMEVHKLVKANYDALVSIFEQGIKEGAFRDDIAPLHMALFLESSMHCLVGYMLMIGDELPIDKVREGMQAMFYHGILKKGKGGKK